ncbi:pyridoxamine 5'-phosphate oxidase family protein [Yoonia litorea]|uniref:Pyridoxamine 5'-phosphate oxidase N-terminal domain-containing protein n=1 Tax=Yoonia litorea TaxID=1123755 RepID=A0A1I6L3Q9_9RHOB|nr:pyridoxamine 5'-phosphate oxidase family protein [Yoonia litorea]SFR98101.1 hypothetical protein SAMN05444714_0144 [Yoonia litorea]
MGDHIIRDVVTLEALYGQPGKASLIKVVSQLTPLYRKWIMASRFCVVSTVGPEGTDGSPRGDDGPVVQELNVKTLLLPDWRGNNRIDTLRNIVEDGRISLMFAIPGSNNVVRVNGHAVLSTDPELIGRFNDRGRVPRSVAVITIKEIYTQCARAMMRANLWGGDTAPEDLPTVGEILTEQEDGFDGKTYDAEWAGRAEKTMW